MATKKAEAKEEKLEKRVSELEKEINEYETRTGNDKMISEVVTENDIAEIKNGVNKLWQPLNFLQTTVLQLKC